MEVARPSLISTPSCRLICQQVYLAMNHNILFIYNCNVNLPEARNIFTFNKITALYLCDIVEVLSKTIIKNMGQDR